MSNMLEGKAVLVTGGARGLGAAIIRRFADEGAIGVAADLTFANDSDPLPEGFTAIEADISDEDEVRAMIEETVSRHGRIDCLIVNAGLVPPWSETTGIDLAQWDQVMAVNARGALATLKHAVPALSASGGSVVLTGSINSLIAHPRQLIYTASKHAVLGILRAAALDLGRFGIRVNGIAPGPIATDALLSRIRARAQSGPSEAAALEALESQTALGRLATAQEVAATVAFLAGSAASGISGQLLRVDAGMA